MKYFIYLILYKNIMTNSFIEFPRINQKQGSINLYKILNQQNLAYIYAYKFKSWLHKKKNKKK